jgi:hypothetical protein
MDEPPKGKDSRSVMQIGRLALVNRGNDLVTG